MRVTNKTLVNNFVINIRKNLNQMEKVQNQLSSGKEVSKPSDDPFRVSKSISFKTAIDENNQYLTNIEDSIGWVDMTDSTLDGIVNILQRTRELIAYSANGTLSDTDLSAIKVEVQQLYEEWTQTSNNNYDGRYILGGQTTTKAPFEIQEDISGNNILNYNGDDKDLFREIAPNVVMKINITGDEIVNAPESSYELGDIFDEVINALNEGNTDDLTNTFLGEIDYHIDNNIRLRSKIGAISNRLEAVKQKNETENINLTQLMSKNEDIDLAEKIMEYTTLSNVYQASLATGAKIIQPTLLDYLR